MDTQSALGNAGAPFQIDWNGKPVTVLYRVQRIKAKFERWLKQREIQAVVDQKEILPEADYQKLLREKMDEINDPKLEKYHYDSDYAKKMRTESEDGKLAFARTIIDVADRWSLPELQSFLLQKGDELMAYVDICNVRVAALLKELGDKPDPKEVAQRLIKAGLWE